MNMLSFGDRNLPIDSSAVRRHHGWCVCSIPCCPDRLCWVCAHHGGVSVLFGGGDHPRMGQHSLEPPHYRWHASFTGGGVRLSSQCSAQLPTCTAGAPQLWGRGASLLGMLSSPCHQWGLGSPQCPTPSQVSLTGRIVKWDKMVTAGLYSGSRKERVGSLYSSEWWSLKCNQ